MKKIFIFNILIIFLVISCVGSRKKKGLKNEKESQRQIIDNPGSTGYIHLVDSLNNPNNRKDAIKYLKKIGYTLGKVIDKTNTSGCKFVIQISNSKFFEPLNLESKFKKDSLDIIFKYKESKAMTTCMIGQPIVLSSVGLFNFATYIKTSMLPEKSNSLEGIKNKSIADEKSDINQKESIYKNIVKLGYSIGKVIDKTNTSGCDFVIEVNDSSIFEPINLESKFKKDGLKIAFKYKKSRAMTTCMMGQTVVVSEIKALKEE